MLSEQHEKIKQLEWKSNLPLQLYQQETLQKDLPMSEEQVEDERRRNGEIYLGSDSSDDGQNDSSQKTDQQINQSNSVFGSNAQDGVSIDDSGKTTPHLRPPKMRNAFGKLAKQRSMVFSNNSSTAPVSKTRIREQEGSAKSDVHEPAIPGRIRVSGGKYRRGEAYRGEDFI